MEFQRGRPSMIDIDTELLIALIEIRPALWDKTDDAYKDRNKTRKAWEEVCEEMNSDIQNLGVKERNAYMKEVMRRWANVRDAFAKFCKRKKEPKKSGAGASGKYIYSDQLNFLCKLYDTRDVEDNVEEEEDDPWRVDAELNADSGEGGNQSDMCSLASKKRRKLDEFELRVLKAIEGERPNRHSLFFDSILPSLEGFSENEILKFQMGVLYVIDDIKKQRESAAHPSLHF